jgi:hypothetical protein
MKQINALFRKSAEFLMLKQVAYPILSFKELKRKAVESDHHCAHAHWV